MQLYNVKLRLAGSLSNEVRRNDVTPAEIITLQYLHGHDTVVDVRKTRTDSRPHLSERDRLVQRYGMPVVEKLFGPAHRDLPTAVPNLVLASDADEEAEKPRRGRKTSAAPEKPAAPISPPPGDTGFEALAG